MPIGRRNAKLARQRAEAEEKSSVEEVKPVAKKPAKKKAPKKDQ